MSSVYEVQAAAENSREIGDWSASVEGTPATLLAFVTRQADLRFFATSGSNASLAVLPEAEHGSTGYTYELLGLPAGLAFAADTRVISGAPARMDGAVMVTYSVEDADGDSDTQTFAIAVDSLDVDRDGALIAADGVMVARYMLGVRGDALVDGQSTKTAAVVERSIESGMAQGALNVDGDAAPDADDGLLVARYMLGLRGAPLTNGLSGVTADADAVAASIRELMP